MSIATPRFPTAPAQILALPTDARGYPVPWFVAWIDGQADFRCIGEGKLRAAIKDGRCWICGGRLGRLKAFVIGPMCAVNRVSPEPPSHLRCAVFAAEACPFLTQPKRLRNAEGAAGEITDGRPVGGVMIARNPGVALVWATLRFKVVPDGRGGLLFDVGRPERTLWFAHGRPATRAEVLTSIDSGLPLLRAAAAEDGPEGVAELERCIDRAMALLPSDSHPLSPARRSRRRPAAQQKEFAHE